MLFRNACLRKNGREHPPSDEERIVLHPLSRVLGKAKATPLRYDHCPSSLFAIYRSHLSEPDT